MISVCKTFSFESAHFLPYYSGNCHNHHGHSYKLEVEISGPIQTEGPEKGMIVDFKLLKKTVMDKVVDKLDHQMLNTLFDNPTAEEMVYWIAMALNKVVPLPVVPERVRLWETSTSYAEWRKDI
jgi:6-pyruvoyltetrahydropterin/6-carboxytetrahydropterin synthase